MLRDVAVRTLAQVRRRFEGMRTDQGVQAAFGFLLGLSTSHLPATETGKANPPLDLAHNPSPLRLASSLDQWVKKHAESLEYAELATRAAADAIATWTKSQARQRDLFSSDLNAEQIWTSARTASAFTEVSRTFFGKALERYLKYFLEREASAELPAADRERFSQRLASEVDRLSKHTFASSKITESFAAAWFNKHAREHRPSDHEIAGFLRFAFSKLQAELSRQESE